MKRINALIKDIERNGNSGIGKTEPPRGGLRAILAAFAKDTSKAAEAVKALLAEEDPEKLKALGSKLIADLPTLIPDDPALAAVIADAMAAEFGSHAAPAPSGALANEDDAEIFHLFNEDREENGRFAQKGSGDRTGGETNLQKRQRTCKEALDAYRASTDHPSVDYIVSGRIGIRATMKTSSQPDGNNKGHE